MEKLAWICLSLASLTGPVWGALSPAAMARDLASWPPALGGEDARLDLEELNSQNREVLRRSLEAMLGPEEEEDAPSKAGLRPDSFQPESIKQALLTSLPRAMFLSRLLANSRKQYKKRGNLSECFWKYCV